MEFLSALWLPILLSAVFVFIASSIFHMVLTYHRSEYRKLDGEDAILEELRKHTLTRGEYFFPCAPSMKEANSPEMVEKMNKGPVGMMTVMPNGPMSMGKNLMIWFIYTLVIGVFAAYLAYAAIGRGGDYLAAFRLTGTVAVLAYGVTPIIDSIWKGKPWGSTFKHVFDGVIYGLVTAGTFGWLWPSA